MSFLSFKQEPQFVHADVMNTIEWQPGWSSWRPVCPCGVWYQPGVPWNGCQGCVQLRRWRVWCNWMTYTMLTYVRQLNCLVMFVCDFGPWMLIAVQMNGHVLHLGVLLGVVAGGLVAGCHSLDRTSISRMLVSRLYAIIDGWSKIWATSVRACRRLQLDRKILRTRWMEGW